mgnify:CR=1 FL=1
MIKEPIYFISDNHFMMEINHQEAQRRKKLITLFDEIKKNNGSLVIGGDFFDFWFEYYNVIPKYYNDLINELKKLNSSGVQIYYVLGNHDYWDFGSFKKLFDANIYKNDFDFNSSGQKIKVTHGDGMLKNDYAYRIMSKIIRSRIFIKLFSLLHPDLGCWIAKKISKTAQRTKNNSFDKLIKKQLIDSTLQMYPDFDKIFIGHYHQIGIDKINNKEIIFMGDWISLFTVTIFNNGSCIQRSWNN